MITLRRIDLESTLNADALRARLGEAIGRSALNVLDASWSGDIDAPFVGTSEGFRERTVWRRHVATARCSVDATPNGSAVKAELGLTNLGGFIFILGCGLCVVVFWPLAIVTAAWLSGWIWYDMNRLEARLRAVVTAAAR